MKFILDFQKIHQLVQPFTRAAIVIMSALYIFACSSQDSAIAEIDEFISEQQVDKSNGSWKTSLSKPPTLSFDPNKTYFWDMQTNKGSIRLKLFADTAPMHVSSTIYLTRLGFYDGIIFHRVIAGFMAQGGDPLGIGSGNPGYRYGSELGGNLSHDRAGLLSMANAGPGTDGSQFFITFVPTTFLDGKHTIFGEVVTGMETVKLLEQAGSRSGRTSEELVINKAVIVVE